MQAQEKSAAKRQAAKRNGGPSANKPASAAHSAQDLRDTRQHVIEAAIRCIMEKGFYRASSNAIAERAGLTWGVIQYYFGTRESLMLAVLQEGSRRLGDRVSAAHITGSTTAERMEQFFDVLADYYAAPDYLAFVQVLVNLSHDPHASAQTRQTLVELNERADPELNRLLSEVLGDATARPDIRTLVFHTLRGLSISHVMLNTVEPIRRTPNQAEFLNERRLLARALTMLVESA